MVGAIGSGPASGTHWASSQYNWCEKSCTNTQEFAIRARQHEAANVPIGGDHQVRMRYVTS